MSETKTAAHSCAAPRKHTPGEPVQIEDEETHTLFNRITCSECGCWLSDESIKE
jgi:hypothetical protein